MSKKLQTDNLRKYQLERESQELNERVNYLSRLLKNKDEAIFKLENEASTLQGEVIKIQENYRQIDNRRQRELIRSRYHANE